MVERSPEHLSLSDDHFIRQLELQAAKQAVLETRRVLPKQLDFFTAFVGTHSWQVLAGVSFVTAVLLEVWR